jgi:hypothetical protein
MKEYKLNLTVFFSVIAIFSMTVIGILLMITHKYNWTELITLVWNYGYVTIPLSIIWLYFEKKGWQNNFWKWTFKIMHFPPDLRGRWEGTIDRVGENCPHKFVIEIKQTMTKLQVYTYSSRGISESLIDTVASDKMEDDFTLCYLWEGETGVLPKQTVESGKFKGFTILKFIVHNQEKKLVGEYFTDRKPKQTMGKIEVTWMQKELFKQF